MHNVFSEIHISGDWWFMWGSTESVCSSPRMDGVVLCVCDCVTEPLKENRADIFDSSVDWAQLPCLCACICVTEPLKGNRGDSFDSSVDWARLPCFVVGHIVHVIRFHDAGAYHKTGSKIKPCPQQSARVCYIFYFTLFWVVNFRSKCTTTKNELLRSYI